MRTVIQRVKHASVTIDGKVKSEIGSGLLVLLGIEDRDTEEDVVWLTKKVVNLRIFDDENGVMNRSVLESNGDILVVSQFTLHASTKKGTVHPTLKLPNPTKPYRCMSLFAKKWGLNSANLLEREYLEQT